LRAIRNSFFFLLAWLPASAAAQDLLPSALLLRCDVKELLSNDRQTTPYSEKSRILDFQLKDGVFTFVGNPEPIGTECKLLDGDMVCEASSVAPPYMSGAGLIAQKRHSNVRLSRTTGEIHVFIEIWDYVGARAEGTPTSHTKVDQSGVCRMTGKALF
jgi:hypothetical protein